MDDNKSINDENQPAVDESPIPRPIFETIPVNQQTEESSNSVPQALPNEELAPEEVSEEVATPEEALDSSPPDFPPEPPMPDFTTSKIKYLIIGVGAIFFVFIFIFFLKLILGTKAPAKDITLQYWGLWDEKEIYQPLISQYEAKNPHVKIQYQKMSPQEYREKLITRSKNGKGPDIFRFHNTWLPEIQEVASPLPQNVMSNAEFEKTFYPIHAKDLKAGKYYYGIPLQIDGLVLIYNDGLLKKAGIDKAPTTWEEVTEDVTKLAVKDSNGDLINSPIAIGTASNVEHFSDIFGLMLLQNGGDLKNLEGSEAIGALESYRKLAEAPGDFWNDTMPNSIAAFIQEKVAMIIVPSWETLTIKSANPDLELKVTTTPRLPGAKQVALATYWVEGVSRYSQNQVEAWKFLKFLVEKENLTKIYAEQSKTRLVGTPYSRVDLGSTIVQNGYIGAVIQQADAYVSLPLISRTHDKGLNDEIIKYLENAINSTVQGVSYGEALRIASQGISQVYSRFKIE